MVTFAYGCAHAFFFMNGMTCVCVCACPGPSAVFVDYKVMRISREKTEHTDYTTALVQPKALHCSPGSSDQLMRGDSVWRKVLRPGWWNVLHGCWKYRKCFILYTNLRCSVEQGYTTTRLDGITPQSSADLSLYRFVAHNAHTHSCCCEMQQEKVSLQHALQSFPKTHTCMFCEDSQCISQPVTPSQLNAWP